MYSVIKWLTSQNKKIQKKLKKKIWKKNVNTYAEGLTPTPTARRRGWPSANVDAEGNMAYAEGEGPSASNCSPVVKLTLLLSKIARGKYKIFHIIMQFILMRNYDH